MLMWRRERPKIQQIVNTNGFSEPNGQREFLEAVVTDFYSRPEVKFMAVAERYYRNENDVLQKRRTIIAKDLENHAILKESKVLSNNKLCHNYMKKLTRQKIAYMLGKPFTLTARKTENELEKEFFKELESYLTMRFFQFIKNVGKDSIVKGIGWVQVYYDEQGVLKFRRCEPEEVIPFWEDNDHTELGAVIRRYKIERFDGAERTVVTKLEYYQPGGVYYYIYDSNTGKLVPDPDATVNPAPHFNLKKDTSVIGVNWGNIPFIPFKYDSDEQSLLSRIKTLIDDYDNKCSEISDAISDNPNSTMVIKNYDGASKEEFVQNKNEYRTIFVQGDGDAKSVDTPINVTDLQSYFERLRQDIYEFGQGVNTADKDIRDTSGVALRFIYADLDMDCVDWGSEVKTSLMQLIWFIQMDILTRTKKNYLDADYDIIFNTDVIINESETVLNCLNSKDLISAKTIAAHHPWTIDEDKEMDDLKTDREEMLELEGDYGNNSNSTNTPTDGN